MKYYQALFLHDPFIRVSPLYNIITIFDSTQYERQDYDVLGKPQRQYILKRLLKTDHKQQTGNLVANTKSGQRLCFVKNARLAISPLENLLNIYNHDDIFIVTPSCYFLFLLNKLERFKDETIKEEIYNLIKVHPVNLEQSLHFSKHTQIEDLIKEHYSSFKEIQGNAIKTELSGKQSLGQRS